MQNNQSEPSISMGQLDPKTSIAQQLNVESTGPVVLINLIQVAEEDAETMLKEWEEEAAFMKKQSGFISTQMHKVVGGNTSFLNYAVWESLAHFRAVITNSEHGNKMAKATVSTTASPLLFERMTIPNVCVG